MFLLCIFNQEMTTIVQTECIHPTIHDAYPIPKHLLF